jgi:malonyl CoA-acyl carrier protein transacylase
MRDSQEEFAGLLARYAFKAPAIPVIANGTGTPYAADAVRETLGQQIGSAVRWLDSMLFLLDQGVDSFDEVGPGHVLTKLIAQIRKKRV